MITALLLAAIITEKCNVFLAVPAWVPERVESCYIPYGTYTDGHGDVEYTRVTSNLTACLISTIDGYVEREMAAPLLVRDPDCQSLCGYFTRPMYTPASDAHPIWHQDDGRYYYPFGMLVRAPLVSRDLSEWSKIFWPRSPELQKSYIGDYPAPWRCAYEWRNEDGDAYYSPCTNAITNTTRLVSMYLAQTERNLCGSRTSSSKRPGGLIGSYSSAALRDVFSSSDPPVQPPIAGGWVALPRNASEDDYPFSATNAVKWVNVWPVYQTLGYDDLFYPSNGVVMANARFLRPHIVKEGGQEQLSFTEIFDGFLGNTASEYRKRLGEFAAELPKYPLTSRGRPVVLEDVLSSDLGWEYPRSVTNDVWFAKGAKLSRVADWMWDTTDGTLSIGGHTNLTMQITLQPGSENITVRLAGGDYAKSWNCPAKDPEDPYSTTEVTVTVTGIDGGDYPLSAWRSLGRRGDNYYHWTNGTTRLDWKRLGIVAQMERQMERTYEAKWPDEEHILMDVHTDGWREWVDTNVTYDIIYDPTFLEPYRYTLEATCSGEWGPVTNGVEAMTNELPHAYSTAWSGEPEYSALGQGVCKRDDAHIVTDDMISYGRWIPDRFLVDLNNQWGEVDFGGVIRGHVYLEVDPASYAFGATEADVVWQGRYATIVSPATGREELELIASEDVSERYWVVHSASIRSLIEADDVPGSMSVTARRGVRTAWSDATDDVVASNLTEWVSPRLWNPLDYISSCGLQWMDGVVASTGDEAPFPDPLSSQLDWDDDDPEFVNRWYRMPPARANLTSRSGLTSARLAKMQALNEGVQEKFAAALSGGVPVQEFGPAIAKDITDADRARCLERMPATFDGLHGRVVGHRTYRISFALEVDGEHRIPGQPYEPTGGWLHAPSVEYTDEEFGDPSDVTWHALPRVEDGYVPFVVDTDDVPTWDAYGIDPRPDDPPARRADGRDANMFWVDWRFKNLKEAQHQ